MSEIKAWKLRGYRPGAGLADGAAQPDHDETDWLPAQVPGEVHSSLLAAKQIPDPYYHMNVEQVQWVERQEWWYRAEFAGPEAPASAGERDLLTCEGLDTYATIYLNGEMVGEHGNMFRPAVLDVTGKLAYGRRNVLAVRFDPVMERIQGREVPGQWGGYGVERVHVRKTQSQFSWDWAPRCVNVGIWLPVRLERFREARLARPYVRVLQADSALAVVLVEAEVESWVAAGPLQVSAALRLDGAACAGSAAVQDGRALIVLSVPNPRLWWPAGMGDQPLYDLEVTLSREGQALDTHSDRVGLRTVALDRTPDPDEPGAEHFTIVINGVPVFCKGADWIPADLLSGKVDAARYEEHLRLLVEANGNMLRVWGGGQWEKDAFYELADQMGIMIWHDFMFSCALYPDSDPAFVAEVRAEAEYQVRRLRNRACIVLWCGNNENDWIEDTERWADPGHDFGGKATYHQHLPEILGRLDPSRPYWPSSPYGGNDHNSDQAGDRHNWVAWHGMVQPRRFGEKPGRDWSPEGVSYRHYGEDKGRFISEFGMHAAPVLETLRRNVPESELYFGSEGLLFRNKDNPKDKGNMLMRAHTGLPKDLAEYIDYSMICQAEGLKFGIEHYRRRKFHCSGTLFWQWNDCWPGLSWSVLDYYAFPKASYFFAKRAYAPVLATAHDEADGAVSLWVTNDTLSPLADTLEWQLMGFTGEVTSRGQVEVRVGPNCAQRVACLDSETLGDGSRCEQVLWLRGLDGVLPENRHLFVEIKDLVRARPKVDITWERDGDSLVAHLRSDGYAYFVWLFVPVEGMRYSDNWFDLPAGQTKTVRLSHPGKARLAPEMVQVGWR